MYASVRPRYEAHAKILKAISHPSRLFIVEELQKQERCVNELTEMIGVDTSTVSKHLSVLKNAGLVIDEKRGNSVYYTLRCPCIVNFLSCVETVLAAKTNDRKKILRSCKNAQKGFRCVLNV